MERRPPSPLLLPLLLLLLAQTAVASSPDQDGKVDFAHDNYGFSDWSSLDTESFSWIAAESVAGGLLLSPIQTVAVDVTVNLLLVGFEEDPESILPFSKDSLTLWFKDVEDSLRHTFLQAKGNGAVDSDADAVFSKAVYNFKYQVLQVSELVNTVLEAAVNTFMRPSEVPSALYQVDVTRLEPLIESFLHSMDLLDSYTLIIWKPKKFLKDDFRYGYRMGFSEQDMQYMAGHHVVQKADETSPEHDSQHGEEEHADAFMDEHDPDHESERASHPRSSGRGGGFSRQGASSAVRFEEVATESHKWAKEFLAQNYLLVARKEQGQYDPETCDLPPTILIRDRFDNSSDEAHGERGHTINMKADLTLEEAVQLLLATGTAEQKAQLRMISSSLPVAEGCLTENWVGSGRYAFIDLSAGPFSWGPLAGGEGVKTLPIFPNLEKGMTSSSPRYRQPPPTASAGQGRRLHQVDQPEAAPSKELDYDQEGPYDYQYFEGDPLYMNDYEQDGYGDDGLSEGQGSEEDDLEPNLREVLRERIDEDVYKTVKAQYCEGKNLQVYREFCAKLLSKYQRIEYIKKKDLMGPKQRPGTVGVISEIDTEEQNIQGRSAALLEDFGAQMGTVLSETLRHLIAPVTLLRPYQRTEHWTFQVYLISDHGAYDPASLADFSLNLERFEKEMKKLRLQHQYFSFVFNRLEQKEDRTLSMAFSNSLHTANVETFNEKGERVIERRSYLDSGHLRHHLVHEGEKDKSRNPKKHLPIFIFSVTGNEPLFIDKYYQAASLGNMVVVAQSNFLKWPSPYFCNSKPLFWNLRDPTQALLLATTQALFGVLPNHVGYDDVARRAHEEWMWSVGDNPHSVTTSHSLATRFSAFHVDQVRRQQVLILLEHVLGIFNNAVAGLSDLKVDPWIVGFLKQNGAQITQLQRFQSNLELAIQKVGDRLSELQFQGALSELDEALSMALDFKFLSEELSRRLRNETCTKRFERPLLDSAPSSDLSYLLTLLIANMLILSLVIVTKKDQKVRVKID